MKYFVVRETGSYINNKNDLGKDWNMYISWLTYWKTKKIDELGHIWNHVLSDLNKSSSICLMTYDYWLGHTLEIYGVNMSSEKLKLICIQWWTMKLKWVIFIIHQITRIKRKLFELFNSLSCWDWYNLRKAKSPSVVSFSLLAVFHPILCYPQYKHNF